MKAKVLILIGSIIYFENSFKKEGERRIDKKKEGVR
jgi:hypothetical protein